jgi:hypothetical protein
MPVPASVHGLLATTVTVVGSAGGGGADGTTAGGVVVDGQGWCSFCATIASNVVVGGSSSGVGNVGDAGEGHWWP